MSLDDLQIDGNIADKTILSESELESAAVYFLLFRVGCILSTVAASIFSPCVFFLRRGEDLSPDD